MSPWRSWAFIQAITAVEDTIVKTILQRPGWHRFVGRIHREVDQFQNGRDPNEPLRPGEATEDPNLKSSGFLAHFVDEIRNQARGTPTDPPPPPPTSRGPPK